MTGPWLVVGLGNPGPRYAAHRHNVGHMVVDELARRTGATLTPASGPGGQRPRAVSASVRLGVLPGGVPGPAAVLAETTTYMNESGGAVGQVARYLQVAADNLVVVHDELDISFADVRVKRGGGEGGHNGLKDISRALGTRDYLRVRVGIGRPPGRQDPADYVLSDFPAAQRRELGWVVDRAADAVETLVRLGLDATQRIFHAPLE
ncbi:MAG: aminoacyl-tRNA hydrolase [Micrococcales bacterium]|nr:aminoacyl-tRNA hydrolase [Micrococcales bacterium]MCL2667321.1 aminoacyl-tRNA hydrolase [Micrococcales bacterium]